MTVQGPSSGDAGRIGPGECPGLRAAPVRAGLVTPCLYVGGAERWMLELVRYTPSVQWVGCCCLRDRKSPMMVNEMARLLPVLGFSDEAIGPLLATTDVLVCWGHNTLDQTIPEDYPGKVVLVSHGADAGWTANVIRGSMGRATHWVAVSEVAKRPYQGLVDSHQVTVIPNGIAPARCLPKRPREETRSSIGLGPDDIAVGFLGRIAREKRPSVLAEAVARLGPPYRAIYVGAWLTVPTLRPKMEQLLSDRVTFLAPVLDVGDLLAAMDVFVSPSPSEGFGLAVCEALYAGVRVVSGRVGVLLDIAAEHGPLWEEIPEQATADDLAGAIRAAIHMPPDAFERRRATVRRAIEQKYLAEHMGRRWEEYLRRIVQEP